MDVAVSLLLLLSVGGCEGRETDFSDTDGVVSWEGVSLLGSSPGRAGRIFAGTRGVCGVESASDSGACLTEED